MTEREDRPLQGTEKPAPRPRPTSPWLPLTLLTVALLIALGFQTYRLFRDRSTLQAQLAQQPASLEAASKVRSQLESIATRVQQLAQQGNPNAAAIVAEFARRGVAITPGRATQTPGVAPAPASSK